MIRGVKSHNEHGIDCCEFFALAAPHRWKTIQDFMHDRNGTVDFVARTSVDARLCFGSCGLPPDQHLMFREDGGYDLELFDPQLTPSERRLEIQNQQMMFKRLMKGAEKERGQEHDAQVRRQKRQLNAKVRDARYEYKKARMEQLRREDRAAAQAAEESRARAAALAEQEAAAALAPIIAEELAAFEAHRPIVEAYIQAQQAMRASLPCVHCRARGYITFERHGHIFPWPCACIGGQNPSCVANWKLLKEDVVEP